MTADSIGHALDGRRTGDTWMVRCPAHDDRNPSLAVSDKAGKVMVRCHAGCSQRDVVAALKARGVWESAADQTNSGETSYSYTDQSGVVVYQVVRRPGKKFSQRRPGPDGTMIWGLGKVEPVPYRLPELVKAQTIYIVEGEKDADNLSRAGIPATCNNGGAGNFKPALVRYFKGKDVVILPDNDEPGRKHAAQVALLLQPVASALRVVHLPGLPDKGDVSDYLAAGHGADDIRDLCQGTALWSPVEARADVAAIAVPAASRVADLLSQPFNDYGNSQRIIAMHGDALRYCHAFRSWLRFDGTHWETDRNDATRKLAQDTMLEFARQALNSGSDMASKYAGSCLNSQRLTAALREAEPHLAVSVDDLDKDVYALNFSNGTVDLRSGTIRPHNRADLITKWIPRPYNPRAACPAWKKFLTRVVPGLEDFVQRASGYSATGVTSEKAIFIAYGGGNNGKTTLLATLREVLGDYYAVLLQIDTLMTRNADNNSQADLADLRGARFVMTSETEEGQRIAEGKLKRLTQGMGRIKAVRKYENPVEFAESHKLWLDCNHKPIVRGTDQAIWNRLRLIPFTVTIPESEIDRELPVKLIAEGDGVLAWIVEGAVRWYREGLGKPAVIESAGKEWRSEMDQLGRFLEERCVVGNAFRVAANALYGDYKRWAEEGGEHFVTSTAFGLRIKERFEKKQTERGAVYLGIGLRIDSIS